MQTDSSTMMLSMHDGITNPTRTDTPQTDRIQCFWNELQQRLGERTFRHWFLGKTTISVDDDAVRLGVAGQFLATWMQKHFQEAIELAAAHAWGPQSRIEFVASERAAAPALPSGVSSTVDDGPVASAATVTLPAATQSRSDDAAVFQLTRVPPQASAHSPTPKSEQPRVRDPLSAPMNAAVRRSVDLADFVQGRSNELAFLAVKQVGEVPGARYNPLYMHGGVGIGKTHLLNGLAKELRRQHPGLQILLLTAENFANAFTQGLREKSLPSFRQRFRSVDVLLVDDVDFFDNKRAIQEEFLHTLKHLESHGKQVVLTSDRHPRLLTNINEELVTRFLSGVVCRIESPDLETRKNIVRAKIVRMNLDLAPEVEAFVANRFQANVREIEGALFSLQAVQSLTHKRVSLTMAKKVLSELERDCLRVVRIADIEQAVCQFFGVPAEELKSPRRSRKVSQPRMLAMFLARKLTTAAYSEIGEYFGGRNHSTAVSAEQRVQSWIDAQENCQVSSQRWSWGEIIENLQQQLSA